MATDAGTGAILMKLSLGHVAQCFGVGSMIGGGLLAEMAPPDSLQGAGGLFGVIGGLAMALVTLLFKDRSEARALAAAERDKDREDRRAGLHRKLEAAQHQIESLRLLVSTNTTALAASDGKLDATIRLLVENGTLSASEDMWPRLLLVEDDARTAQLLSRLFTAHGFEVHTASTVPTALAELGHAPAVVVLDLGLPDGDGVDVLKAIKLMTPAPRVVVTTGVADPEALERVRALAPDGLLSKPIDAVELIRAITTPRE
jgi:CheY-like chemotaxis protein